MTIRHGVLFSVFCLLSCSGALAMKQSSPVCGKEVCCENGFLFKSGVEVVSEGYVELQALKNLGVERGEGSWKKENIYLNEKWRQELEKKAKEGFENLIKGEKCLNLSEDNHRKSEEIRFELKKLEERKEKIESKKVRKNKRELSLIKNRKKGLVQLLSELHHSHEDGRFVRYPHIERDAYSLLLYSNKKANFQIYCGECGSSCKCEEREYTFETQCQFLLFNDDEVKKKMEELKKEREETLVEELEL